MIPRVSKHQATQWGPAEAIFVPLLPVFKERMRWFSLCPSPEDLMNVGNQERIVLKAKYNKYTE